MEIPIGYSRSANTKLTSDNIRGKGTASHSIDLNKPTVTILKEEMESRGVMGEGISIVSLAIEAIAAVNPDLLQS